MNGLASRLFADYASAHATRGNRRCHLVGIPLIVFSIVLALSRVPLAARSEGAFSGPWTAAELAIVAATAAALFLDAAAAALFFIFLVASDLVCRAIPAWTSPRWAILLAAALFVLGWVFQLVGHAVYEKNRPAFLRNLSHLLVGPLWIAKKLF